MDVHDTIGFDLVGMVVDDLVVCGAEPLFMTDYIATGRVVPERIAAIVKGIAEALRRGRLRPGRRRDRRAPRAARARRVRRRRRDHRRGRGRPLLGPGRVRPGDVVIAMEASGLHSNGYSLVRHVLLEHREVGSSTATSPSWAGPSARSCSTPTRIYAKACLDLADRTGTHAMSHVTGGGLAANLERVMPVELAATIDRATWTPQPVFDLVRRVGDVPQPDLEATLNCGVGMVALTPPEDADTADRGARRARHPGLGGRRGPVPTPSGAVGSIWSASTPAGDHWGSRDAKSVPIERTFRYGCAGTAGQQVALAPRDNC